MSYSTHFSIPTSWNFKRLFFCHALAAILLISLFLPAAQGLWAVLDIPFFKWINSSLEGHPRWQIFWALANHKWADWIEDLCVLLFFVAYVRQASQGLRIRRIAELLICILYIAAILYFVNKTLFREHLKIPRLSPTLVVDSSFRLSEHLSWLKIKDDSSNSFPGDHATTAILFAAVLSYLSTWRLGLLASCYAAFLCMPRLITGAHWLSDVIVGSGAIALIFLSWLFCTPLFDKCTQSLERLFRKIFRIKSAETYTENDASIDC